MAIENLEQAFVVVRTFFSLGHMGIMSLTTYHLYQSSTDLIYRFIAFTFAMDFLGFATLLLTRYSYYVDRTYDKLEMVLRVWTTNVIATAHLLLLIERLLRIFRPSHNEKIRADPRMQHVLLVGCVILPTCCLFPTWIKMALDDSYDPHHNDIQEIEEVLFSAYDDVMMSLVIVAVIFYGYGMYTRPAAVPPSEAGISRAILAVHTLLSVAYTYYQIMALLNTFRFSMPHGNRFMFAVTLHIFSHFTEYYCSLYFWVYVLMDEKIRNILLKKVFRRPKQNSNNSHHCEFNSMLNTGYIE